MRACVSSVWPRRTAYARELFSCAVEFPLRRAAAALWDRREGVLRAGKQEEEGGGGALRAVSGVWKLRRTEVATAQDVIGERELSIDDKTPESEYHDFDWVSNTRRNKRD